MTETIKIEKSLKCQFINDLHCLIIIPIVIRNGSEEESKRVGMVSLVCFSRWANVFGNEYNVSANERICMLYHR